MTLVGVVAMVRLPVALYPNMAAPVEQQMTGVANMIYMYSTSQNSGGQMTLRVDFDLTTDANTDQVLSQARWGQAQSQLPAPVQAYGVNVKQSATSPLALFTLYSPK